MDMQANPEQQQDQLTKSHTGSNSLWSPRADPTTHQLSKRPKPRGKGMPVLRGRDHGDFHAQIRVETTSRALPGN
jgi:hypothetical protein